MPALNSECQPDNLSVDCTRWNPNQVATFLEAEDSEVDGLFPNLSQKNGNDETDQTCKDVVREFLETGFTSEQHYSEDSDVVEPRERCYTNCTVTLSSVDGCTVSVFLLESMDARKISDLYSLTVPSACGIYNITCCDESLSAACLSEDEESRGGDLLAPIVGGVVGSVLGLTALIVTAVVIGVVVMVCMRRKKEESLPWYVTGCNIVVI